MPGTDLGPQHTLAPIGDQPTPDTEPSLFEYVVLELLGFDVLRTKGEVGRRSQLTAYLVLALLTVMFALGVIVVAYVAKTVLGIDLMADHSPLHFIADGIGYH